MSAGFGYITPPTQRNPARGSFFEKITKNANSQRITGGKDILVTQTASGVTISSKAKPIAGTANVASGLPCKITGGNSLSGYTVDVYAAGRNNSRTGTAKLYLLEIASTYTLPVGSWVIGFTAVGGIVGGTE